MKPLIPMLIGSAFLGFTWPASAQEAGPKPPVEIVLAPGEASAVPQKCGVAYANGGITDVAQPNATTVVVTMSGLTATNADLCRTSVASYAFELMQGFGIVFNSNRVKSATLTLEGRVIGLLRTDHDITEHHLCKKCGTAETHPATALVTVCDGPELLTLSLPARSAGCCEDLSVYNHEGPLCVGVGPGKYILHQEWGFGTTHPAFHCRGASAEFAPQPSYSPGPAGYWFEHWQPFNGTATKDFGFQVTLKLVPEFKGLDEKGEEEKNKEQMPAPKDQKKKEEAPAPKDRP